MKECDARAWIAAAQASRWHDLDMDIRNGINTSWSMAAGGTAVEILSAIRLVGPTDPGHIQWPLLAGGVYAAILDVAGVDYDEAVRLAWEAQMSKYGTLVECTARLAGSVAAIRADADRLREDADDFAADFLTD